MEREKAFKIALLGDGAVGKTSIRRKYMGQGFSSNYMMTLGADFAAKREITNSGQSIILQIWDLAGQPPFKAVRKMYYDKCSAIIIVFSVIDDLSLNNIKPWYNEYLSSTSSNESIPIMVVGNKLDLKPELRDDFDKIKKIASELIDAPIEFYLTSARTGENIDRIFKRLTDRLVS